MDAGTETPSTHFSGQWAFLSTRRCQYGNPRSLPASSQTPRREVTDSSLSQQVPSTPRFTFPRSTAWRPGAANSIGTQTPTLPSQPVIVPVHSADASAHQNPAPRTSRFFPSMNKKDELPPVSDFSIEGILAAIEPEIEGTIDAIAEIMGRSRLTLANEYDSHMPPQGEIRAGSHPPLLPVEEASSSNERLAADNVIIVPEDASLVDGSNAGSAAYGLLERLRAAPRPRRQRSDAPASWAVGPSNSPVRTFSSPAVLSDQVPPRTPIVLEPPPQPARTSRTLLRTSGGINPPSRRSSRPTNAIVSETYLHAGANGRQASNPPMVSESGRNFPLYSYDESDLFELPSPIVPRLRSFRSRMQSLRLVSEIQGLASWLRRHGSVDHNADAQTRLRGILDRHGGAAGVEEVEAEMHIHDEPEMYD
jgi:hypothetical protein